jgi:hypothetical protein
MAVIAFGSSHDNKARKKTSAITLYSLCMRDNTSIHLFFTFKSGFLNDLSKDRVSVLSFIV